PLIRLPRKKALPPAVRRKFRRPEPLPFHSSFMMKGSRGKEEKTSTEEHSRQAKKVEFGRQKKCPQDRTEIPWKQRQYYHMWYTLKISVQYFLFIAIFFQ
ncbi:hypothetical protein, partial [Akkermansia sp.]|uniref:hypothetical protein n=2 Tax=Akkermansia TaxID=239934 RepID=UPI0025C11335